MLKFASVFEANKTFFFYFLIAETSSIPVLSKKQKILDIDTDSDTADEKIEVKEKPKATVRGRSRVDLIEKVRFFSKKKNIIKVISV